MSRFWLETDLIVRAGAGTGKTYALVTQYLHLVAGMTARRAPVAPSRIVAISFTEKAAAELAVRIRERLHKLADGDTSDETELCESARALAIALPPPAHFEAALGALGGAPVATFHGFGGALLRRHAVAAGIDPAFRVLDDGEASERLCRAAEEAVLDGLGRADADVERLVDDLGYRGAGFATGVVEALAALHARRGEEGRSHEGLARNYELPLLERDVEAAGFALRSSLRGLVSYRDQVGGETLRKLDEAERMLAPALAALARRDAAALHDLRGSLGGHLKVRSGGDGDGLKLARERVVEALSVAHAACVAFAAAPLARALERLLGETAARYRADKDRIGALDFTDLIQRAGELLASRPDVCAAERARVDALLVDEFQDTNESQARLVRLLAEPTPPVDEGARVGRLVVVGDRKQSIYEFRGADVAVSVSFDRERVERHGARRETLGVSRRSRPALVELANAMFARLMRGAPDGTDAAWAVRFDEGDHLQPLREGGPACCAELLALPSQEGPDTRDAATRRAIEAAAVARRLVELRAAERPARTALLLRAFTHLDEYLDALRTAGLPYYVVNGRGFFETQEVRDLAAALRLLDDPDDAHALLTVLRSPLVALSDVTLARLALARALAPSDLRRGIGEVEIPSGERTRLERWLALHETLWPRADRLGAAGCLRALVDGTHLVPVLAGGYHGEQRVANLERLVDRARVMEQDGVDLRGFVRWLSSLAGEGDARAGGVSGAQAQIVSERDDVVRVMTVHQAKGLEFELVAVAGCGATEPGEHGPVLYDADGGLGLRVFAGERRADTVAWQRVRKAREQRREAEALRLLYVAVTRARDRLILSGEGGGRWRKWIDEALADERVAALVAVRAIDAALALERPPPVAAAPIACFTDAPAAGAGDHPLLAQVAPRPTSAARLTVAVTQLADFALCPRRYHLFHEVGLSEHPAPARAASSEAPGSDAVDGGLDPLARGTLAHHLLEHADLARAGADLDGILEAEGYDPRAPVVAEVRDHARAFLETTFARDLADRRARCDIRRELPFLVTLPVDDRLRVELRGQIDLLVVDGDGREVTVVDYKHARAGAADDYRLQLDAYALAATLLLPGIERVRVGLAFLRDADPAPRLDGNGHQRAARFRDELVTLGRGLAAARSQPLAEWEDRPVETCRAIHCGYVYRCHPSSR